MNRILLIVTIAFVLKASYFAFTWLSGYPVDKNIFKRNDSFWYEKVATQGHHKITPDQLGSCEEAELKQSYYAFFPLYPALVGSTMRLFHGTFTDIAFIYSIIFSLTLYLLSYKFFSAITGSESIGFNSTVVLILFPFHYYFSVYYTEALYLTLLIGSFYTLEKKSLITFSVVASLLVLVRPNGLFMLLPLFMYYLERHEGLNFSTVLKFPVRHLKATLCFAVPVVMFTLYCVYLKAMTGDFFAYKTAQAGWCRETVFPWVPILRSSNWMEYFNSIYLLSFCAIAFVFLKKIPLSFSALIWIGLVLPLTANSITSPRFISAIFVFPLIFGRVIHSRSILFKISLYCSLFILHLFSFQYWLQGSEFSY